MKIGILAMQGAFIEHILMFDRIGVRAIEIRLPGEIQDIDGLIIPGGESTTMMRLMRSYGLVEPIKSLAADKIPLWGTCAGMICLAKPQAERVHSLFSSSLRSKRVMSERAAKPTTMGTSGTILGLVMNSMARSADNAVAATASNTHCHFILRILIIDHASINPRKPVIYHL